MRNVHAYVAENIIIGEVVKGTPISLNVLLKVRLPKPFFHLIFGFLRSYHTFYAFGFKHTTFHNHHTIYNI